MDTARQVQNILEELYLLDPSLKKQEQKVSTLIHQLIAQKPETPFSDETKEHIYNQLLQKIAHSRESQKNQTWRVALTNHFRRYRFQISSLAIASILGIFIFAFSPLLETHVQKNLLQERNVQETNISLPEENLVVPTNIQERRKEIIIERSQESPTPQATNDLIIDTSDPEAGATVSKESVDTIPLSRTTTEEIKAGSANTESTTTAPLMMMKAPQADTLSGKNLSGKNLTGNN